MDMMLGCALQQNAHTAHIWFTIPIWCNGTTLSQMWKFFILFMARSTWILKLAISRVATTSSAAICADAPRKGGKFKVTPKGNKSWIVNPLSAIIESLSSNGSSKKTTPSYNFSIRGWTGVKLADKCDCSPRRYTNQALQCCVILTGTVKFSIQLFICPNLKYIKLTNVINILLTVGVDTLNKLAKWSSGNPCLTPHITIKNSSRSFKDRALPFFVSNSSVWSSHQSAFHHLLLRPTTIKVTPKKSRPRPNRGLTGTIYHWSVIMRSFSVVLNSAKRDANGFFKVLFFSSHLLILRHPVWKSKFGACAVTGYCPFKDQLIEQCHSTTLRWPLIREKSTASLSSLLDIARSMESANFQAGKIENASFQER